MSSEATIKIRKASGVLEDLNIEKLKASLKRSGASDDAAEEVIDRVLLEIQPVTSTSRIYKLAKKHLKQYNHASSLRYSLKKALFRLGPTGYPFEKYIGEIMKNYGYEVTIGTYIKGECIDHEVDVLGIRDGEVAAVECKYHNVVGRTTDVKVAMYVHSRFRDIEPKFKAEHPDKKFHGWLVTNTRCTENAIQYADCYGFKVLGWQHPNHHSLQKIIEDKRLYPVTVITGIQRGIVDTLISKNIVLLKDLSEMEISDIRSILSLNESKAAKLKQQAMDLCLRRA
ncbi:MAG: restriction endonuclease [Nitrospirota bacterium]|nr:MAG: restriction endonuclease [Nitrospirota bacterium]